MVQRYAYADEIEGVVCVVRQHQRSADWMDRLVRQHGDRLLRTAAAMMGSKEEAEDVVQDAFLTLLKKDPAFQSPEHETAWLIRVTVNLCKSRLRSHWWKTRVPLLESHPAQDEEQQGLMESVLKLPSKYRIVIHLFYYEGYPTKEIAALTGQSDSAVRSQLSRARHMLRNSLEGEAL